MFVPQEIAAANNEENNKDNNKENDKPTIVSPGIFLKVCPSTMKNDSSLLVTNTCYHIFRS